MLKENQNGYSRFLDLDKIIGCTVVKREDMLGKMWSFNLKKMKIDGERQQKKTDPKE